MMVHFDERNDVRVTEVRDSRRTIEDGVHSTRNRPRAEGEAE
jgi:hypothetical protein